MKAQPIPPSHLPVLITRPQPQADRLAADLLAEGLSSVRLVVSPLMQAVFPQVTLPEGDFNAVILTSEAGAMAAKALRPGLPGTAYCVGRRTAEVARASGFDATSLGQTAAEMLPALAAMPGPFLYLRGREASVDVAAELRAMGKIAQATVIYAQDPAPLSAEAQALLAKGEKVVVPLYSRRSTRLLVEAIPPAARSLLRPILIASPLLQDLPEPMQAQAVVVDTPDGKLMQVAILRAVQTLPP
ncbi:uroporphyrinogen-III synthase [Xinfangfangia sp. CPCC 101601]|uniref:Uroporphyrinogen-III synthase n=1 Tax=Pseudogemmobacter lacusdianii TaxID=3069608 RepID=A0ABU0VU08_9RHOB|nr:uroporphyrinogen-III synthase [Xinfangfangia sp. CPCC 101601]MDQ2065217.1 uroporphyrinogen-III synthase [Xinfangfangia sp. CPCC 101601]